MNGTVHHKHGKKTYSELESFVKENGHARVPFKFPKNRHLGIWVSTQRAKYKQLRKGEPSPSMTEDRIELLNKVGFEWDCSAQPWERTYEELVMFVQEFGDARVPHKFPQNPPLGNWVALQRYNYKKLQIGEQSCMTEERINLLNQIDFEWDVATRNASKESDFYNGYG